MEREREKENGNSIVNVIDNEMWTIFFHAMREKKNNWTVFFMKFLFHLTAIPNADYDGHVKFLFYFHCFHHLSFACHVYLLRSLGWLVGCTSSSSSFIFFSSTWCEQRQRKKRRKKNIFTTHTRTQTYTLKMKTIWMIEHGMQYLISLLLLLFWTFFSSIIIIIIYCCCPICVCLWCYFYVFTNKETEQ